MFRPGPVLFVDCTAQYAMPLPLTIHFFSSGVADEPDYASCEASIGRLDMDISQLKDNLVNIFTFLSSKTTWLIASMRAKFGTVVRAVEMGWEIVDYFQVTFTITFNCYDTIACV